MSTRIAPAVPPFSEAVEKRLAAVMPPGVPPLTLFTTLARNPRVFDRFMAGGLLDKGTLSLRQRELIIDRTCALCGSAYEWGVHVAFFGERVALTPEEIRALAAEGPDAACWTDDERLILRLVDQLHARQDIDDGLFAALKKSFAEEQLIEMIVLCGFYHTVSFVTNGLRIPLEAFGTPLPTPRAEARP